MTDTDSPLDGNNKKAPEGANLVPVGSSVSGSIIPQAEDSQLDDRKELRQKIFNISLKPINDIYYVPPGIDGSVGLDDDRIDKIIELFELYCHKQVIEAYKELLNAEIIKPEYHNLIVGKITELRNNG